MTLLYLQWDSLYLKIRSLCWNKAKLIICHCHIGGIMEKILLHDFIKTICSYIKTVNLKSVSPSQFSISSILHKALQCRHNECLDCLLNCLFRCRWKKTSKLCITGLCEENPPVTGGFPSQGASNTENVSIWWHHHGVICSDDVMTASWHGLTFHITCPLCGNPNNPYNTGGFLTQRAINIELWWSPCC